MIATAIATTIAGMIAGATAGVIASPSVRGTVMIVGNMSGVCVCETMVADLFAHRFC
jgi:hypothetical protein